MTRKSDTSFFLCFKFIYTTDLSQSIREHGDDTVLYFRLFRFVSLQIYNEMNAVSIK